MSTLPRLKFDSDLDCYTGRIALSDAKVKLYIDVSEDSVDLETLKQTAEAIIDSWSKRHPRLVGIIIQELASNGYLKEKKAQLKAADCVPFSLRVAADSDGEISYSIGFNVRSLLAKDEYVDVEEEINCRWFNCDVSCTE